MVLSLLIGVMLLLVNSSATAGDVYGTFSLEEKEFATVAGKKRTIKMPGWKPNKGLIQTDSEKKLAEKNGMVPCDVSKKNRKTFGVFQLYNQEDRQVVGRKDILVPQWQQKPETQRSVAIQSEKSKIKKAPVLVRRNPDNLNATECD